MKLNLRSIISQLKSLFTSRLAIGGLEVSHTGLKFLLVRNATAVVQASLKLPPGIIEQGLIKDPKNFSAALKSLHDQISTPSKSISVILVIPSTLIYAQPFSVPLLSEKEFEEAARLNLETVSPTDIGETYHDWQQIKENRQLGHVDLLGAFANAKIIDEYTNLLREANFKPIAIEFPGLALARLVKERWAELRASEHYLLIYVNSEGILMTILQNANLYFNHFTPWFELVGDLKGEQPTFNDIKVFLGQEIRRVINFYLGKRGKQITEAILVSPLFNQEITDLAQNDFKLNTRNLTIPELPTLDPSWFVTLGGALRGLLSRANDTLISLTKANTQVEYYQERTLQFLRIWRNIIGATLVAVFIAFIVTDSIFYSNEKSLRAKTINEFATTDIAGTKNLQESVVSFNRLLTLIEKTVTQETGWSTFIRRIQTVAGGSITVERIYADKSTKTVLLNGRASNESSAIAFKNRLLAEPFIADVTLPLSDIRTETDGVVKFSLTAKLKTLDF